MYNVFIRYGSHQQTPADGDSHLYMVIIGENGQTKQLPFPMDRQSEIEFTAADVGKVSYKCALRKTL
jgi:hypothetical protein